MVTWLEAMQCAVDSDDGYTWSFVMQDDALPLRGWQQHLERACTYSPTPIIGLSHFGGYGSQALSKGVPYGVGNNLAWGAAIGYHYSILEDLTQWSRGIYEATGYPNDDRLVGSYAMMKGFGISLAARAIFDQPVEASLLGHHSKIRRPATTIENSDGPEWSSIPRSTKVNAAVYDDMRAMAGLPKKVKGSKSK